MNNNAECPIHSSLSKKILPNLQCHLHAWKCMGKRTKQQINLLAASFYPTMCDYFQSDEGKAEYQRYLEEKASFAMGAETNTNDDSADDNANDDNVA